MVNKLPAYLEYNQATAPVRLADALGQRDPPYQTQAQAIDERGTDQI